MTVLLSSSCQSGWSAVIGRWKVLPNQCDVHTAATSLSGWSAVIGRWKVSWNSKLSSRILSSQPNCQAWQLGAGLAGLAGLSITNCKNCNILCWILNHDQQVTWHCHALYDTSLRVHLNNTQEYLPRPLWFCWAKLPANVGIQLPPLYYQRYHRYFSQDMLRCMGI